jgi:hypothetical protein
MLTYETRDRSKSSSQPFKKFILQIVREICMLVPKLFVSLVQKFGQLDQKLKKMKKVWKYVSVHSDR